MRPERRPTRLHNFDYARPAAYFVTLCTHERAWLFGEVHDGVIRPNAAGRIVDEEWKRSETIRAEVVLDAHVVMPNHLHGIVLIVPPGTERDAATDPRGYRVDVWTGTNDGDDPTVGPHGVRPKGEQDGGAAPYRPPKSLGSFVAGFKSAATRRINRWRGTAGAKVWQYRYHDRILRNEREWRATRRYVEQNPARWDEDRLNRPPP